MRLAGASIIGSLDAFLGPAEPIMPSPPKLKRRALARTLGSVILDRGGRRNIRRCEDGYARVITDRVLLRHGWYRRKLEQAKEIEELNA